MNARTIENEVLAVLSAGRCDGNVYYLPQRQLDRKMYESVNKVLTALGGKWNRSAKGHVFGVECADLLDGAIESGSYVKPADMGWFPTPAEIAGRVIELADIGRRHRVLEPSAGEGAIARLAMLCSGTIHCVEIDTGRAAKLRDVTGGMVIEADFLSLPPVPQYDRVVMNPPFAKRADIHHVNHARKFLRPGGKLVSIMSGGIAFREDRLTTDFRAQCQSIEALPDGAFHESGTDVRTVVVVIQA